MNIIADMFLFVMLVTLIGGVATWYTERNDGTWGEF